VKEASQCRELKRVRRPGTILSSNTTGVSIDEMIEVRSDEFKQHLFEMHFFNPRINMKHLEINTGVQMLPKVVNTMERFSARLILLDWTRS